MKRTTLDRALDIAVGKMAHERKRVRRLPFGTIEAERDALRAALRDLVDRCDGDEGVRADGSNIQTIAAHAALGDFLEKDGGS